ncbi:Hypothetical predicted protein [Xyrichtys novacula]|uniref:Uncharacterized protein n=1 Tax=Xyrichtys novacula TaxID=13765 RepID=A0AAV1GKZ8_XYRNO|nr:Hypothetical predicted protein [Xyrichtys novacula]
MVARRGSQSGPCRVTTPPVGSSQDFNLKTSNAWLQLGKSFEIIIPIHFTVYIKIRFSATPPSLHSQFVRLASPRYQKQELESGE